MPIPRATFKTEIIPILCIVTGIISSFYFYQHFPASVATHWNIRGQADGYSSRAFAAFFFPGLNFAMYLLFLGLPYLDPKKERYEDFAKVYHVFKTLIIGFMTLIYFVVGFSGIGYRISVGQLVPLFTGIMFVVMGNYMGKIRPNWFMGIRTPWTLSNDEVWTKTHRLGGKLFILAGVLLMLMAFAPGKITLYILIAGIFAVVVIPMVYSFILFKKLKR